MFNKLYSGKKVLVTGHTGFKGSWLTEWLLDLGAQVCGIALEPATSPSLFKVLELEKRIEHHIIDIRELSSIKTCIDNFQPEVVFHLAAQPLVRLSYEEPAATWETNVMGTVNVLETIRNCSSVKSCVIVTTDKCYENKEWCWGYREIDPVGGHDPYSASKGAAEIVVSSYRRSFMSEKSTCSLASARAGNVIGGGDWSSDRIVVDFVKSIQDDRPVCLRNPNATRPWQHVLEPLSGYLLLGANLLEGGSCDEAWNFGPPDSSVVPVIDLAKRLVSEWGKGSVETIGNNGQPHEAGLLKLDCSKAKSKLNWSSVWGIDDTVKETVKWYSSFYENQEMVAITQRQIMSYQKAAIKKNIPWAMNN